MPTLLREEALSSPFAPTPETPLELARAGLVALDGPILVVEDDDDIRVLMTQALREEGLPVEAAADGLEALARASRRRPALVVLDMLLPHLDGMQVAARLHATYGKGLPILVVTAVNHPQERARGAGATVYLRKPFDLEHLITLVYALLAAYEA